MFQRRLFPLFAEDDGLIDFGSHDDDFDLDSEDGLDDHGNEPENPPEPAPDARFTALEVEDEGEPEPEPAPEPEKKDDPEPAPEPEKKVQTPEENAKFAEERRKRQVEEALKQTPEYKLAQSLSEMYDGAPIDEILKGIEQAKLDKLAKERGVPVEFVQEQNQIKTSNQQLQNELNTLQFQIWQKDIQAQSESLKSQYPMLNDQDMVQAQLYLLETLQNPNVPLEQAVHALHGKKIQESQREILKNEILAELSGRGQTPPPPQTTRPAATEDFGLTPDEIYVAKTVFGMTPKEYAKWKK